MKIKEVCLITFSPTHTSKRVGEAIVCGTGCENVRHMDLTLPGVTSTNVLPVDALVVVTVPVYGGHVAPLALERMRTIKADGTPVVIAVIYGNRAYEKALVELDAFVSALGFKVIAGATFVGEHSYSNDTYPVAVGRPDADDLVFARQLGEKVWAKVAAAVDLEHLYGVDVARIQRPHQPFWPLFRFLRKVVKLRKSGIPLPRTPQVHADLCTHCGYCAAHCPNGAIVGSDECNTIADKCIRCCACVKGCPQKARSYDTPFAALLSDCFVRPKENRMII